MIWHVAVQLPAEAVIVTEPGARRDDDALFHGGDVRVAAGPGDKLIRGVCGLHGRLERERITDLHLGLVLIELEALDLDGVVRDGDGAVGRAFAGFDGDLGLALGHAGDDAVLHGGDGGVAARPGERLILELLTVCVEHGRRKCERVLRGDLGRLMIERDRIDAGLAALQRHDQNQRNERHDDERAEDDGDGLFRAALRLRVLRLDRHCLALCFRLQTGERIVRIGRRGGRFPPDGLLLRLLLRGCGAARHGEQSRAKFLHGGIALGRIVGARRA